jgi:hypothetical protein
VRVDVQLAPVAPPVSWIAGDWVLARPYSPATSLATLGTDGKGCLYDDVYGEQLLLAFSWSLVGDTLTIMSPDGTVTVQQWTVSKISDDEFTVSPSSGDNHFYRKLPGDSIFTTPETTLSSVPTTISVAANGMKLCSFTAPAAGVYSVSWSATTGYLRFHGYLSDQRTVLFEADGGSPTPTKAFSAGQKVFIVVDCGSTPGGCDIWVQPEG